MKPTPAASNAWPRPVTPCGRRKCPSSAWRAGGSTNADIYRARAQQAVGDALAADLGARNARVVIFLLETEGLLAAYPPEYRYYLAEAYRIRGREGDAARAESEYLATLQACPDYAPTYGALGLVRMQQGRNADACALFDRYLALDPEAPDRAYIEGYLGQLREAEP